MKADSYSLRATLYTGRQYSIPIFQRYYSWEKKDWEQLWVDIMTLRDPNGAVRSHFLGPVVFVPELVPHGNVNIYHIIDGQQRLLTVSIVLCALRNVASEFNLDSLVKEIEDIYLTNQHTTDFTKYKVYPRQRDRAPFVAMLAGERNIPGRIGEALSYFSSRIRALPESDTEGELRSLFLALQNGLEFVHIYLTGENPYQIFKSLNSKGVPLSKADLIRNFIFMNMVPEEHDDFAASLWNPLETIFADNLGNLSARSFEAFFRDFLMMKGGYVGKDDTFEVFETRYMAPDFDPRPLTKQLLRLADFYATIRGWKNHPSRAVNSALAKLRSLETSTSYPLILNLFDNADQHLITEAELVHSLELLSGFVLRRLVGGYDSRGYGRFFANVANNLRHHSLSDLHFWEPNYLFPDDNQFRRQFLRYDLYNSKYARVILAALEHSYKHKEPAELTTLQVEHIMPQNLNSHWRQELGDEAARIHSEWLHTPGNLTLTGYNPELSDRPFSTKREQYANSNIVLTRNISSQPQWTEAEIEERGKELAERATRIWISPHQ
jgi:hypothetical protein